MSIKTSLTTHLLHSHPSLLTSATTSPFLTHAGTGTLPRAILSSWLSQDRLYAQTYITFIASLISRVQIPHHHVRADSLDKKSNASLDWKVLLLLKSALDNICRELGFFDDVGRRYGLRLDEPEVGRGGGVFRPSETTERYVEIFTSWRDGREGEEWGLLEGLVVLWATELCYLMAWGEARRGMEEQEARRRRGSGEQVEDLDGGALRKEFIPNWTSGEFQAFVREIGEAVDEVAEREGAMEDVGRFERIWVRVLEVEKGFWPDV